MRQAKQPDTQEWLHFFMQLLVWSGAVCLVSGVLFFFAYNWEQMGRFQKFALVESILVGLTLIYLWVQSRYRLQFTWLPAVNLTAMAILIGVALGLVGQTYQTGADPWQLFAIWAALITPLVLLGRTSVLWLLWGGLLNLGLSLYLSISQGVFGFIFSHLDETLIFSLLNLALAAVTELLWLLGQKSDRVPFLNNRLAARTFLFVTGGFMTALAVFLVFDFDSINPGYGLLIGGLYVGFIFASLLVYRQYHFDLLILSGSVLSMVIVITAATARSIESSFGEGGFLVLSLVVIGSSSVGAKWLKQVYKTHEEREGQTTHQSGGLL